MLKIGLGQGALARSAIFGFCASLSACGSGGNHADLFEYAAAAGGRVIGETGPGGSSGIAGSDDSQGGNGGSTELGAGGSRAGGGPAGSSEHGGSSGAGGSHEVGGGGPLLVEYLCNGTAASNSTISFHVRITNKSNADLPLDGLSVRYYFTNDAEAVPVVELDYGAVSAPNQNVGMNLASRCVPYGPKPTANMACEVSLSGLMAMSPDANLQLQLRIHTPQYQILTQTNDYSFDATKTAFAPWDHLTVHRMGMLLFGVAP